MTEPKITEEAKAEAERRWNENYVRIFTALEARNGSHTTTAIDVGKEILAAHIQTTSDVAEELQVVFRCSDFAQDEHRGRRLQSLILPDPKDPLEEVMREVGGAGRDPMSYERNANRLRASLAKRGLQITPIEGSK